MNGQNYEKQAQDFLDKNKLTFTVKYLSWGPYFMDEKESRSIFRCVLRRGRKSVSFRFGQSIADGNKPPTPYDLLACITKSNPGDFENFCADYGFNSDSRKDYKSYLAVCKEWEKVERFFSSEELEELQDIN